MGRSEQAVKWKNTKRTLRDWIWKAQGPHAKANPCWEGLFQLFSATNLSLSLPWFLTGLSSFISDLSCLSPSKLASLRLPYGLSYLVENDLSRWFSNKDKNLVLIFKLWSFVFDVTRVIRKVEGFLFGRWKLWSEFWPPNHVISALSVSTYKEGNNAQGYWEDSTS